eukprot:scaffold174637_cov45-Prasinocladus_malaysianus.AAC.2
MACPPQRLGLRQPRIVACIEQLVAKPANNPLCSRPGGPHLLSLQVPRVKANGQQTMLQPCRHAQGLPALAFHDGSA